MTLLHYTSILRDLYDGVVGILRKKARHRCTKRGQDWDEYEKPIKDAQRVFGRQRTKELMSNLIYGRNPLLEMLPKSDFSGQYFPIPVLYNTYRRKRSRFRNLKGE